MHEAGVGLAVMPPPPPSAGVFVASLGVAVVVEAGGLSIAKAGDTPQSSRLSPKIRTPKKPKRVEHCGNKNPCCLHFLNF
jgi:hypothetical protein